ACPGSALSSFRRWVLDGGAPVFAREFFRVRAPFRHVLYITKYFTSTRFSCGLTRLVRLGCAGIFTNRHQPGRYLGAPGFGGILKGRTPRDRKSTRLNSSHDQISYAVFCLKKKSTQ